MVASVEFLEEQLATMARQQHQMERALLASPRSPKGQAKHDREELRADIAQLEEHIAVLRAEHREAKSKMLINSVRQGIAGAEPNKLPADAKAALGLTPLEIEARLIEADRLKLELAAESEALDVMEQLLASEKNARMGLELEQLLKTEKQSGKRAEKLRKLEKRNKDLEGEVQILRSASTQPSLKRAQAEGKVTELQGELAQAVANVTAAEQESIQLHQALEEVKKVLIGDGAPMERDQELETLRSQLAAFSAAAKEDATRAAALESTAAEEAAGLSTQLVELDHTWGERLTRAETDHRAAVAALEAELGQAKQTANERSAEAESGRTQVDALKKSVSELEEANVRKEQELKRVTGELAELQDQLANSDEIKGWIRKSVGQPETSGEPISARPDRAAFISDVRVGELEAQVLKLQAALTAEKAEMDEMRVELATKEAKEPGSPSGRVSKEWYSALQEENTQLIAEHSQALAELEAARQTISENEADLIAATQKVSELGAANETQASDLAGSTAQVLALEKGLSEKEATLVSVQAELEVKEAALASVQAEMETLRQMSEAKVSKEWHSALQEENTQLIAEHSQALAELEAARQTISEKEADQPGLELKLAEAVAKSENAEASRAKMKGELEALEELVPALTEENTELHQRAVELEADRDKCQRKVQELLLSQTADPKSPKRELQDEWYAVCGVVGRPGVESWAGVAGGECRIDGGECCVESTARCRAGTNARRLEGARGRGGSAWPRENRGR